MADVERRSVAMELVVNRAHNKRRLEDELVRGDCHLEKSFWNGVFCVRRSSSLSNSHTRRILCTSLMLGTNQIAGQKFSYPYSLGATERPGCHKFSLSGFRTSKLSI